MDCYFHSNVPSIAACSDCRKPICATCRDEAGTCPSCRLAAKVEAATATRQTLGGQVPPRSYAQPPPHPQPQPTVVRKAEVAIASDPVESRALVALGYPLWPLALLSLFDRKQSRFLRLAALQALGFNVGIAGFAGLLMLLANLPILGFSASVLIPFLIPLFLVASVYYGVKTWNGDEVRIPIITDWIEDRVPGGDPSHSS
jgi:uncharacterized membrane protein